MDSVTNTFARSRIILICRRMAPECLIEAAEAAYRGGIRLMEVTFDQSGLRPKDETPQMIEKLRTHFDGRMHIGAGTVLEKEELDSAVSAGAEFIVSPDASAVIIAAAKDAGLVSIPGAMTPTEIMQCHRLGADYVKVFPSNILGPEYFSSVLAPLSHIKLLAVGSIDAHNIPAFRNAGAYGFALGSSILRRELIEGRSFENIEALARQACCAALGEKPKIQSV